MTNEEALQILDTIPTIGEQVDALEMAIKALEQQPCPYSTKDGYCQYDDIAETIPTEQEPCDDVVSRKDIQDYIAKYLSQYLYEDVRQAVEAIDTYIGDMPSVTPKSGKWILTIEDWNKWTCSNCGYVKRTDIHVNIGWKFCPNCGAKMQEVEDE